jgi:surface antigen
MFRSRINTPLSIGRITLCLLTLSWAAAALAQPPHAREQGRSSGPPAHAPAHGWRARNDPYYLGYSGVRYERDYGIAAGNCNREAIAAVVGGVVGGVLGSRVATEYPEVGTIVGALAGAFVGRRIGRTLDERDRGCIGHALEIGQTGQPVTWMNESTGVQFELVPGEEQPRNGAVCRQFSMATLDGSARSSRNGVACQTEPGVWEML